MKIQSCIKPRIKNIFMVAAVLLLSTLSFAQSGKAVVTKLSAQAVSSRTIMLTWELPKTDGKTVVTYRVYRDVKPFLNYSQVEYLKPLSLLPEGSLTFSDNVPQGQEFFYAVVSVIQQGQKDGNPGLYFDEETDARVSDSDGTPLRLVLPGVNATTEGVRVRSEQRKSQLESEIVPMEVHKKEYPDGIREKPLPYIDVLGGELSPKPTISQEAKDSVQGLMRSKTPYVKKALPLHIFEEDMVSPVGGDDYLLFEILKTSFIKKKYTESITSLKRFLAQNRSAETANRANFYLAESYYYTGNFSSALMYFLSLEEVYPELTRKWIESTLDLFTVDIELE